MGICHCIRHSHRYSYCQLGIGFLHLTVQNSDVPSADFIAPVQNCACLVTSCEVFDLSTINLDHVVLAIWPAYCLLSDSRPIRMPWPINPKLSVSHSDHTYPNWHPLIESAWVPVRSDTRLICLRAVQSLVSGSSLLPVVLLPTYLPACLICHSGRRFPCLFALCDICNSVFNHMSLYLRQFVV